MGLAWDVDVFLRDDALRVCTMSKDVSFKQFWFGKDTQKSREHFLGGRIVPESPSPIFTSTPVNTEGWGAEEREGWGAEERGGGWGVAEGRVEGPRSVDLMNAGLDGKKNTRGGHLFFCLL